MTNVKLSKRLSAIANMVGKKSIVADIGCDHALLDIYLTSNNISKKAYACDITEGAINQAIRNIKLYNAKHVLTRFADGLNAIKKEDKVDTVIISGLGNHTIIDILTNNNDILDNVNTLIIQSNTKVSEIRKNVTQIGYYIKDEKLVLERNIIYTIIKFSKGSRKYSKKDYLFGPILLKNRNLLFNKIIDEEINNNNKILNKIPRTKIFKRMKIYKEIMYLNKYKLKK